LLFPFIFPSWSLHPCLKSIWLLFSFYFVTCSVCLSACLFVCSLKYACLFDCSLITLVILFIVLLFYMQVRQGEIWQEQTSNILKILSYNHKWKLKNCLLHQCEMTIYKNKLNKNMLRNGCVCLENRQCCKKVQNVMLKHVRKKWIQNAVFLIVTS